MLEQNFEVSVLEGKKPPCVLHVTKGGTLGPTEVMCPRTHSDLWSQHSKDFYFLFSYNHLIVKQNQ